jgi:hypothetical protein
MWFSFSYQIMIFYDGMDYGYGWFDLIAWYYVFVSMELRFC